MTQLGGILICTECLTTSADSYVDLDGGRACFGEPHRWVEAQVTDCPFTRRDKRGTFRAQWRQEANRRCSDETHHYGQVAHITVPGLVSNGR